LEKKITACCGGVSFFSLGDVFSQVGDWAFRTTVAVGFLGLQENVVKFGR